VSAQFGASEAFLILVTLYEKAKIRNASEAPNSADTDSKKDPTPGRVFFRTPPKWTNQSAGFGHMTQ